MSMMRLLLHVNRKRIEYIMILRELKAIAGTSCAQAKAFLTKHHVVFNECSLAEDASAMDELIRLGCRVLPVIRIDDEISQGFDAAELRRLLRL